LLLPPSVPGALVNFSALLMGKSAGKPETTPFRRTPLVRASASAELRTVLTSRRPFWKKLKLHHTGKKTLFLEDVALNPGSLERLIALLAAAFSAGQSAGTLARLPQQGRFGRFWQTVIFFQRQHRRSQGESC